MTPTLLLAVEEPSSPGKNESSIPAISLLPAGSELENVILPTYDDEHQLTAVMKASIIRLVSANQIAGDAVNFEFFNPDRSRKGRIDFLKASYDEKIGMMVATGAVKIAFARLDAVGTGLRYSTETNEGILLGPASTLIKAPPKTTMKIPSASIPAMAFVSLTTFPHELRAAPPTPITPQQMESLAADSASRADQAQAVGEKSKAALAAELAAGNRASKAAKAFLIQADLPVPPANAGDPEAKPLAVAAGMEDTLIECDGEIYFDAEEGVLVYMKNVSVKDPRFKLTGANELKVFFDKKPAKAGKNKNSNAETKSPKKGLGSNFGDSIGDPARIVASGTILIEQTGGEGKEPIQASGGLFTYNIKADEVIISGRFPWVRQGNRFFSSKQANNLLRIFPKKASFDTPGGGWKTGFPLDMKKP